jgi:hypothetical protein
MKETKDKDGNSVSL